VNSGQPEASFSKSVVRSLFWTGGGHLVGQVISWLATLLVIRLLSSADFGLMAMAGVLPGVLLLLADLGLGAAAIQSAELNHNQLRGIAGLVYSSNLAGCLIVLVSAPWVADFFGEPRLGPILRVLSFNFLLVAVYTLPQAQLIRRFDFKTKARIDLWSLFLGTIASLALAWMGAGVWALVGALFVQHLVRAVAYNIVAPVLVLPGQLGEGGRALARFGALVSVDRLLFYLHSQMDILIGGRALGKESIGIYAIALSLATIPLDKVLPVATQVSFAAFSRIQNDSERVQRNVLRALQVVALVCFPAFLGLAAVAPDFVPLVLGERWMNLVVPVQLLCLVLPFKAVGAVFPPALFGIGRPQMNVANLLISLTIMPIALLIGVRYGVTGLCLAWVIAFPLIFIEVFRRSLKALGVSIREAAKQLMLPAGASLAMTTVILAASLTLPTDPAPARLVFLISLGVVVYLGALGLWGRQEIKELVAVIRS
jgi:teichuronic acid exporter